MKHFEVDFWTVFGLIGQFVFGMRFVVQWIASERKKQSIIPIAFWYLSLAGSILLMIYSWQRGDIVFVLGFGLNLAIYARNLFLIRRQKNLI